MALAPVSFPVLEQGLKQQQQRCLFFIDTRFDDSMHLADDAGPFCGGKVLMKNKNNLSILVYGRNGPLIMGLVQESRPKT